MVGVDLRGGFYGGLMVVDDRSTNLGFSRRLGFSRWLSAVVNLGRTCWWSTFVVGFPGALMVVDDLSSDLSSGGVDGG